jgi:hypothetical protein
MSFSRIFFPAEFGWEQLQNAAIVAIPGVFLLALAGALFTQWHRRPAKSRLLLLAIGFDLTRRWILDRAITLMLKLAYDVAGLQSLWIGFGLNALSILTALVLSGLCWWCLIQAALPRPDRLAELSRKDAA